MPEGSIRRGNVEESNYVQGHRSCGRGASEHVCRISEKVAMQSDNGTNCEM